MMLKKKTHNILTILVAIFFLSCNSQTNQLEQQAREKMSNGKYAEAVSLLDEIINSTQASADIYNMRGVAYFNQSKNAKALTDFDQALSLSTSNYRFYYNRGNVKRVLNRPESAIEDYTEALKLESNQYDIYQNRALSYMAVRNNPAAIQDFDTAETLSNGSDGKVYFYRGKLKMIMEDFEGAVVDFESAVKIDKLNGEAYAGLALAKYNIAGEPNEEICKDIERSIQLGFIGARQMRTEFCE